MPQENVLLELASILVLGIAAQWAATRLRMPSILLLLATGIVAGPVTGFLHPNALFGKLLLPGVSLAVAVILFEGGLSLQLRELREVGGVFIGLCTVGVIVTWALATLAAWGLLGFPYPLALLLGAILVVTGPTVIGPLVRHIHLTGRVGALLRWEGIVIDPLGALLAVLVFEGVLAGEIRKATAGAAVVLIKVSVIGGFIGLTAALLLLIALRRYWISDHLHNAVSLMFVVAAFAVSNLLQDEAGLVAVTVMGIALANQKRVAVKHILAFKEHLSVLLLSSLFIVLAARLKREQVMALGLWDALFVVVLILVVRPVSVFLATLGSKLTWHERVFLGWMAPRGIVAAAVSSVFAIEMLDAGYEEARRLVPVMFLVIIGTVALYGLTAAPLARRLRLAQPNPQGVLLVGAHSWARALAAALRGEGVPVVLADSNWANIAAARLEGLPTYFGSVLSEHAAEDLDLGELGRLLALTANDEVNSLACLAYIEHFGRREVYQLPFAAATEGRREAVAMHHRGRFLFGPEMTYSFLEECFGRSPTVKTTRLTPEFTHADFLRLHEGSWLPVFLIREDGSLALFTADEPPQPLPGQLLISLVGAVAVDPVRKMMTGLESERNANADR